MVGTYQSWVGGGGGFGGGGSFGGRGGGFGGGGLTGPGPASQPKSTYPGPSPIPNYSRTADYPSNNSTALRLNPNIGRWAVDAAQGAATKLAQQATTTGVGNPLSGARSMLESYYGPQTELMGNMLARQLTGMGTVPERAKLSAGMLTRDTDLAQRGFGLDRQAVGLDRQRLGLDNTSVQGQLANLDRLRGLLGKQFGLAGEELDVQLANLGIDEAKLRDMAERQTFDLRSNLTARGAMGTVAQPRGTGRIDRDLGYGLGQIGNARRSADIQHRGTTLGLQEKGIGYDNQGLNLRSRLASNGVDSKALDLTLSRIGLSEEQVNNSLTDGLAKIGFEGEAAINGFLDSIQGALVGVGAEQRMTILNSLVELTGLPAAVLAGMIGLPAPTLTSIPQGTLGSVR